MGLFDRGRKRGQSSTPTGQAVEDLGYEAFCPAGHSLTGKRQESFQAVRCPECGEGSFILPTSWLPVPPMASVNDLIPLSRIRQSAVLEPLESVDSEVEDTEPAEIGRTVPPQIPLKDASRPPDLRSKAMPVDDPAAKYHVETANRTVPQAEFERMVSQDSDRQSNARNASRPSPIPEAVVNKQLLEDDLESDEEYDEELEARPPFYKRIRRGVWIGLGVFLIISLTVFIQLRQTHREKLPQLANLGRTEGIAKLDDGKFDEAKQILTAAASAYDEMRDKTEEANIVRQAARESAIFADLASRPIEDILDSVAAGANGHSDFVNLDQGRSLIIESRVTKTPDQGGEYDLDFRVAVGPGPAPARPLGRLDLKGLKLLENLKPNVGDTVLIGVRLKDFELEDGLWWIRLDPTSGVMITHWKALNAIGWPVTDRAPDSKSSEEPRSP